MKNRAVLLLAGLLNTEVQRPRFRRTADKKSKKKKRAKEKTEDEMMKHKGNVWKSWTGEI